MVSFERKISKDFKRLHKKGSGLIMSLSGKEKFSYGLGAVGKDMVYMLSDSYILYYYKYILCNNYSK